MKKSLQLTQQLSLNQQLLLASAVPTVAKMLPTLPSMWLILAFYLRLRNCKGENGANLTPSGLKHTRGWYFVPPASKLFALTVGIATREAWLLRREEEKFYVAQVLITGRRHMKHFLNISKVSHIANLSWNMKWCSSQVLLPRWVVGSEMSKRLIERCSWSNSPLFATF